MNEIMTRAEQVAIATQTIIDVNRYRYRVNVENKNGFITKTADLLEQALLSIPMPHVVNIAYVINDDKVKIRYEISFVANDEYLTSTFSIMKDAAGKITHDDDIDIEKEIDALNESLYPIQEILLKNEMMRVTPEIFNKLAWILDDFDFTMEEIKEHIDVFVKMNYVDTYTKNDLRKFKQCC